MCSTSFMYDSESPTVYLKSLETKIANEREKEIIQLLSQIIVQNQKIQEMLEKTNG